MPDFSESFDYRAEYADMQEVIRSMEETARHFGMAYTNEDTDDPTDFFCANCGWIKSSDDCCMNYPDPMDGTMFNTINKMSALTDIPVDNLDGVDRLIEAVDIFGKPATADTLRDWTERMRIRIEQEFTDALGDAKAT